MAVAFAVNAVIAVGVRDAFVVLLLLAPWIKNAVASVVALAKAIAVKIVVYVPAAVVAIILPSMLLKLQL